MAKTALKVIDDEALSLAMSKVEPGIVRLGEGKLRVTFDIPEFEMLTIRRDRQIKLEFDQYTTEGLAQHFLKGNRFYNDEAGAAGSVDKLKGEVIYRDKEGNPYKDRDAFLDAAKAFALKAYDKIRLGHGSEKSRKTIGDPVEREMLKQGYATFSDLGWTMNASPNEPDGQEMSKSIGADGKIDSKVFEARVQAYVDKYEEIFRRDAEAAIERRAQRAKQIAEAAKDVQV